MMLGHFQILPELVKLIFFFSVSLKLGSSAVGLTLWNWILSGCIMKLCFPFRTELYSICCIKQTLYTLARGKQHSLKEWLTAFDKWLINLERDSLNKHLFCQSCIQVGEPSLRHQRWIWGLEVPQFSGSPGVICLFMFFSILNFST